MLEQLDFLPVADGLITGTAAEPRLIGSECRSCGTVTFPKQSSCAKCTSQDVVERLLARETLGLVREAIARLPVRQRDVVVLRDVEGWDPPEVCDALGLSEGNQRVLLHRGRSRVREALERHLDPELQVA